MYLREWLVSGSLNGGVPHALFAWLCLVFGLSCLEVGPQHFACGGQDVCVGRDNTGSNVATGPLRGLGGHLGVPFR